VEKDTNKQKKITHIIGSIKNAMLFWKKQDQKTSKKNSHFDIISFFEKNNYGYNGIRIIFNKLEIDITDWVHEKITRERGGMSFMLPNCEGEFYLAWDDIYNLDIKFVNTQDEFKSQVSLPDFEYMIKELEEQRKRHVGQIRNMLINHFNG